MGFRPEPTLYKLKFVDAQYNGLEVTCTSLSVEAFESVVGLAASAAEALKSKEEGKTDSNAGTSVGILLDRFSEALVEWNIDREVNTGIWEPVPATRAGVGTQQLDFILMLVNQWMEAIAGVSSDLGKGSPSGETVQGLSTMMEPL